MPTEYAFQYFQIPHRTMFCLEIHHSTVIYLRVTLSQQSVHVFLTVLLQQQVFNGRRLCLSVLDTVSLGLVM